VFIPAQYEPAKPACVYVKQDGYNPAEKHLLESLIATGDMPITVGVFVSPGDLPPPVPGSMGLRGLGWSGAATEPSGLLGEGRLSAGRFCWGFSGPLSAKPGPTIARMQAKATSQWHAVGQVVSLSWHDTAFTAGSIRRRKERPIMRSFVGISQ